MFVLFFVYNKYINMNRARIEKETAVYGNTTKYTGITIITVIELQKLLF